MKSITWPAAVLAMGLGVLAGQQNRETPDRAKPGTGGAAEDALRPVRGVIATRPEGPTPAFSNYRVGAEDLLAVTVLDAPEFTRQFRVSAAGSIRLPLVKQQIAAVGQTCPELEVAITRALLEEGLLRDPSVSVTVLEFQSKPVTIAGDVRTPTVFQATRPVTLTEAISRAGGITDTAGPEILVTLPPTPEAPVGRRVRVSTRSLLDGSDPLANLLLHGGEEIRVPPAGKVYLLGSLVKPGPVPVTGEEPLTVLRALSLAGGTLPSATNKGYLLRPTSGAQKQEFALNLKRLVRRQDPDLPLQPDDVLFIPDSTTKRLTQAGILSAVNTLIWGGMGVLWR